MNNKLILIFILTYLILLYFNQGYCKWYPSLPLYKNSNEEVKIVQYRLNNISPSELKMFWLTNKSVSYAFLPYADENLQELNKLSIKHNLIILFFKYLINRIRPWQINPNLNPVNISTAQTPAFPAGHAYQAYLLEKYLSKKYPNNKNIYKNIAKKCDSCRVAAGLHYPSDGKFSKLLVDIFYPIFPI
jgi:hypothetical protein